MQTSASDQSVAPSRLGVHGASKSALVSRLKRTSRGKGFCVEHMPLAAWADILCLVEVAQGLGSIAMLHVEGLMDKAQQFGTRSMRQWSSIQAGTCRCIMPVIQVTAAG